MKNNNRITLKQFYDEFIPTIEDIATIKQSIKDIRYDISDIKDNNKDINKELKHKISIKAFSVWLGSLMAIVGIVITILSLVLTR